MAYERKDNTFQFEYRAENIDNKFPALQLAIKTNGVEHECPVWIRNGKYGRQFSGDTTKLIPFMKALFGAGGQKAAAAAQAEAQKLEEKKAETKPQEPVDRKTLLR